jgi:hypothetical protein
VRDLLLGIHNCPQQEGHIAALRELLDRRLEASCSTLFGMLRPWRRVKY